MYSLEKQEVYWALIETMPLVVCWFVKWTGPQTDCYTVYDSGSCLTAQAHYSGDLGSYLSTVYTNITVLTRINCLKKSVVT